MGCWYVWGKFNGKNTLVATFYIEDMARNWVKGFNIAMKMLPEKRAGLWITTTSADKPENN